MENGYIFPWDNPFPNNKALSVCQVSWPHLWGTWFEYLLVRTIRGTLGGVSRILVAALLNLSEPCETRVAGVLT